MSFFIIERLRNTLYMGEGVIFNMGFARTFLSLLVIAFESITIRPTTKHSYVPVSRPSLHYIIPTLPFFNGFKSIYTSKMLQEVKTLYNYFN